MDFAGVCVCVCKIDPEKMTNYMLLKTRIDNDRQQIL